MRPTLPALLAATLALTPLAAPAQDLSDERIKELALQAILENPDIVMEAVAIIQQREADAQAAQARATLESSRDLLTNDPNAPVGGNPDGDVTVVEFFDYNCGFCRRAAPEVAEMLERDGAVRVVYREWPILGEGSVFAARAALAARAQDRYADLHHALIGAGSRLDEATVMEIAEGVGLDVDRLRADMDAPEVQAHLDTSMRLAQSLGFSGTPSFVIGGELVPGMVDADAMLELVDAARDG
ncbi:DsbA family protein [Jannaschia sp. LMIT008]|uniref:DsbA family protein n=1 Tax=Jannaschia maritima TaxID=3032585 RepID=UPI0028110B58|nr:DsbA family protein [Jannaschia sp. LMIT008]